MDRWLAVMLAACVMLSGRALLGQSSPKPPPKVFSVPGPSERLEIDGSKNPELIPEWYVWETFFRHLHKAGTVPSVLDLTPTETRFLQMQAEQYSKSDEDCQTEMANLRPLVGVAENRVVNEKQRAIQLACRRRSLDIRDRLLAGVRPEASTALTTWVENLKNGIQVSVPKAEFAHFRQPQ